MSVLAFLVGALGGGIIASWVGSWFEQLNAFERARLIVLAELMGNLASHHALDMLAPTDRPAVIYSSSAWVTHRDRLAVRGQRHQDVWLKLATFYTVITSMPRFNEPLDAGLEESLSYAIANFDLLELGGLELVPVYGPGIAYNKWRERRHRRKPNALPPTA